MTEMPRYSPAASDQTQGKAPTAPPVMNTVFWLLVAAAVMSVVSAIFSVMHAGSDKARAEMERQLVAQNVGDVTAEMLDVIISISITTVIAVTVISVIAYVVLAIFLKKGMGWARIVAAVLAVLSLGNLVGMTMPGAIAAIAQILLGVVAVVLCFTGAGAAYFRARKNYKLANKAA
ncbi:hypothetical protein ACFUCV_05720 [Specibacter sp. NPDC057265]|uniref:hypothetical protein n=1 Tax=Specibacter sp. NPDC057265 TaxID=3346075 RepID=UPI00364022CD